MYEVFVGRQTGTLVEQIGEKDEAIKAVNIQINEKRSLILGHRTSTELGIDQFMALEEVDPADDSEKTLQTNLEAIENKSKIIQAGEPQKIVYSPPDLSKLSEMLAASIKTLSEDSAKKVKEKLAEIGQTDAESWLERGHDLCISTDGRCPYCWQPLDGSDIVDLYGEYFNKEYKDA